MQSHLHEFKHSDTTKHAFTNSDTTHLNKKTQPSLCTYTPSYHHNIHLVTTTHLLPPYIHIQSITSITQLPLHTCTHRLSQNQIHLYILLAHIFTFIYSDATLMNIYTQPPPHIYTYSVITTTPMCTHTQLSPSHTNSVATIPPCTRHATTTATYICI